MEKGPQLLTTTVRCGSNPILLAQVNFDFVADCFAFFSRRLFIFVLFAAALPVCGQDLGINKATDRARAVDSVLALSSPAQAGPAPVGTPEQGAPKLPGDAEFGEQVIMSRKANWEPWSFSADAQYSFTDNAALAAKDGRADSYLRTGLEAHYTNRLSGNWFVNAGLDGHAYYYDRYDALDFLLVKAEAGLMYQLPWLANTVASAGYAGYWLSESNFSTEAFHNHAAAVGLQKTWKIARGMQVVAGVNAEYSFAAEPAGPRRDECSSYLAYRLRLTEELSVSASYRVSWYDYPTFNRQDWNQVGLLEASYHLTERAKVALSVSAAMNRSNLAFFNYNNLVGGAGVTFTLAF